MSGEIPTEKQIDTLAEELKETTMVADPELKSEDPKRDTDLEESRYEVEVKLADIQADPNSPLYSVKSFDALGLHPDLLKGVYGMKFKKPSKIQERALPLLLRSPPRNMIGQSQSGTGKTAAFSLAMLSRINFEVKATQAICLSPSRELARQTMDVIRSMGQFTSVTTAFAIRDSVERGSTLREQIVVGTPGTVADLIKKRCISVEHVRIFVLDEADNMLDQQGLGDQSIRIKRMLPRTVQVVLFSATFPVQVREFAERFAPNADMITLRQEELSLDIIKQFYMDCKSYQHKIEILNATYGLLTIGQSIIFVQRRDTADELEKAMTAEGHKVVCLHGRNETSQRDQVIDAFRSGAAKVLITTNVLARGIDIAQVNLVINFDLPVDMNSQPDFETYLHRIGRTGRFGRMGVAINFVHDSKSFRIMKAIEEHFGREIIKVPTTDYMEIEEIFKKALKNK